MSAVFDEDAARLAAERMRGNAAPSPSPRPADGTDSFAARLMTDNPVTGDDIRAKVAELVAMDMADFLVCRK